MGGTGRPRNRLMSVALVLAAGYVGWVGLLWLSQRSMMFPGAALVDSRPAGVGIPPDVEPAWLDVRGGRIETWHLPASDPGPAPAVILAHGNAELIEHVLPEARGIRQLGLSVLLVEYPGYGHSDGQPSRDAIGEAFTAAYDWLAARSGVDRARTVGMGRSLGGGAITDLSRHRALRGMVLVSTFTSVADFARRYLVPGFLARDAFDNLEVVRDFPGPILLFHGRWDEVIPYAHGERLARAARDARFVSLDCGHNDCPPDPGAYFAEIEGFLQRAGVLGPRGPD